MPRVRWPRFDWRQRRRGPSVPSAGPAIPEATPQGLWRRRGLAVLAILWERAWPPLWPAVAVTGVFLAASLFDLPRLVPVKLHIAANLALGAFVLGHASRVLRPGFWPRRDDADRRIEVASGLAHRPLQTIADRPAEGVGDRVTAALWRLHRARDVSRVGRLRVGLPRAGLDGVDRHGVRFALALALALGLATQPDTWSRIRRAVMPPFPAMAGANGADLTAWITPPAYSGLPPVMLDPARRDVEALTGSTLEAYVNGGAQSPFAEIGRAGAAIERVGPSSYRLTAALDQARLGAHTRLSIRQDGRAIGIWSVSLLPDKPPQVSFTSPIAATERQGLRLDYAASDDFGIVALALRIRLEGIGDTDAQRKSAGDSFDVKLSLPMDPHDSGNAHAYVDLLAHPWAGLSATVALVAADGAGQSSNTAAQKLILPERRFDHPVARAIAAERKKLARNPGRAPEIAKAISAIGNAPETFAHDATVQLALRAAAARLVEETGPDAISGVQRTLWETALRVEEGRLGPAAEALRAAERELREALQRGAGAKEIADLMANLRQAFDRFAQALRETPQTTDKDDGDSATRNPTLDRLKSLLDRMEQLSRSGARDGAAQLLSEIQDVLENLRLPNSTPPDEAQAQAEKLIDRLNGLQRRQQQVMEDTFSRARDPAGAAQSGFQPGKPDPALPMQQEIRRDLHRAIQDLTAAVGKPSPSLDQADEAMSQAVQSLDRGQAGEALGPEGDALDRLRKGTAETARQLRGKFGNRASGPALAEPGLYGDPLGRENAGLGADRNDVHIPTEMELRRSREILDELRRRAGDRARPANERAYIDRLLQAF